VLQQVHESVCDTKSVSKCKHDNKALIDLWNPLFTIDRSIKYKRLHPVQVLALNDFEAESFDPCNLPDVHSEMGVVSVWALGRSEQHGLDNHVRDHIIQHKSPCTEIRRY
jgi:hypothetical protein